MFACNRTLSYLLLGVCLAGPGLLATAQAAEPSDLVQAVPTADLDLRSPASVTLLHHRIALAARNVCAWIDPGKRIDYQPFADCVISSTREASPRVLELMAKARGTGDMVAVTADAR